MKRIFLVLFLSASLSVFGQEKWRALNVTSINGTNFTGTHFTTLSSSLHWDFNKRWFFSNWTGVQVQYGDTRATWVTTQTTVNRYVGNWMIGVGTQYGLASDPGVFYIKNQNAFAITSASYRWRFGQK